MQIRKIEIQNYKKLIGPVVIDRIGDGITVIAGDNEEGKSTLLQALRAALFDRHNLTGDAADAMQPFGHRVRPEIGLEFEIGGITYRLKKGYCQKPSAELITPTGVLTGPDAEEKLQELLRFRPPGKGQGKPEQHHGVFGMFWIEQGRAFSPLPLSPDNRTTLMGALESEVGQVLGGARGRTLKDSIAARYRMIFTDGGKPRGPYAEAISLAEKLEAEIGPRREQLKQYEDKVDELARTRDRLSGYEKEGRLARAEADLKTAQAKLDHIGTLENKVAVADQAYRLAEAEVRSPTFAVTQRDALIEREKKDRDDASGFDDALRRAEEAVTRLSEDFTLRADALKTAETALDEANKALLAIDQRLERQRLTAERDRLTAALDAAKVTEDISDFPDVGKNPSKAVMLESLRKYEEDRPDICTQERSNDLFYGSTRGKGMLEPFIQWIYVPAVKDASEEGVEAGNTALGKLLQRTVRQKVNFDADLAAISDRARQEYDALLAKEQGTLESLSTSLGKRLEVFAHPGAGLAVEWLQGSEKSVRIDGPKATIKATEGPFKGSLVRFGHGLQRSFLLVILQELAALEQQADGSEKPTLVLGIEEPELYQHPPQARHLSTELRALADAGSQILLTTHSPYFVSGEAFDEIRLVRKKNGSGASYMTCTDFPRFAKRMADATGKSPDKPTVARAKLLAALRPEPSELYFCQKLILVEGQEDRAYVTAALHLENQWHTVRRTGLHMISCDRKSNILQLLCIARELKIPCFVIFDADGDETNADRRKQHERDNASLLKALDLADNPFPAGTVLNSACAIWPTNLEAAIRETFSDSDWQALLNKARNAIDPNASLKKNPVLIAEAATLMWQADTKPKALLDLVAAVTKFAQTGEA